ncbi:hypothetical protein J2T57_004468 [Natronocella acetinitrilica]|uniref:Calcineurin-like phosphoesterase domain-containing protein n=1 Tax=Natronocella acetinitrilica TaxID=414046 RepID=A0AAE3G7T8_9GAMM|nr:hypothetical protein [Natronocella acetinitrilica]
MRIWASLGLVCPETSSFQWTNFRGRRHHHAPFVPGAADSGQDPLRYAYGSDLSELIEETQPALWIFGHIHACLDFTISNTRVVTNCRGYTGVEPVDAFDPGATVEV